MNRGEVGSNAEADPDVRVAVPAGAGERAFSEG